MPPQPPLHILSDFDGTIIHSDALIDLVAHSPSYRHPDKHTAKQKAEAKAREIMLQVAKQKLSYRGAFDLIAGAVHGVHEDEGVKVMVNAAEIDPTFAPFVHAMPSIPLTILSSGFHAVISRVLSAHLGPHAERVRIVASGHRVSSLSSGLKWSVEHVDESEIGHDKSRVLKALREEHGEECPVLVFFGDGLNDLWPSKEADLVFAKKGSTLTRQCGRESIPFREFSTFGELQGLFARGLEEIRYDQRRSRVEAWRALVYGDGYEEKARKMAEELKAKDAAKKNAKGRL